MTHRLILIRRVDGGTKLSCPLCDWENYVPDGRGHSRTVFKKYRNHIINHVTH